MKNKCGMLNAKCGVQRRKASLAAAPARPAFRIPHSAFPPRLQPPVSSLQPYSPRPGITLIELLITMTIMAIISAAILGTAAAAMESARRTRTQSLITKISGLVMEQWDSYANRRVDVDKPIRDAIDLSYTNGEINATQRGLMLADARMLALRELMKMEMPDRWTDILNKELTTNIVPLKPTMLAAPPALAATYHRRLSEALANTDLDAVMSNQRAECLYLVVMSATGDGEARTLFASQDIGDTDEDGAQEFLDGWGEPIQWIRWPAGFISDLQPLAPNGDRPGDTDHDPFDIYRRDSPAILADSQLVDIDKYPLPMRAHIGALRDRNQLASSATPGDGLLANRLTAFRLVPLIFSGGSDQETALRVPLPENQVYLDPYAAEEDDFQTGETDPESEGWRDNIYNHLNEY